MLKPIVLVLAFLLTATGLLFALDVPARLQNDGPDRYIEELMDPRAEARSSFVDGVCKSDDTHPDLRLAPGERVLAATPLLREDRRSGWLVATSSRLAFVAEDTDDEEWSVPFEEIGAVTDTPDAATGVPTGLALRIESRTGQAAPLTGTTCLERETETQSLLGWLR